NLLALQGELAQSSELGVVEADLVYLSGRQLLLESAPVRERADRDAFAAGLTLQHLAGAVEAEVGWDDNTVDHRLTEPPTCFDHALIGASDRILGKHDPGNGGIKETLDDYPDAWPGEEAHPLAIRDRRVRVSRPPDFADGAWDIGRRMNIQQGEVLAGEA